MNIIEDKLFKFIKDNYNYKDNELTMKVDQLAFGISQGRGPTYSALKNLVKKGVIKTQGMGKKGIFIQLKVQQNITNSSNASNHDNMEKTTGTTLEGIRDYLENAPEVELKIIGDLVELNKMKIKNNIDRAR